MTNQELKVQRKLKALRHAEKSRFDIGEMPDWRVLRQKTNRHTPRELRIPLVTAVEDQPLRVPAIE